MGLLLLLVHYLETVSEEHLSLTRLFFTSLHTFFLAHRRRVSRDTLPEMEDEETRGPSEGGGDALHTRSTARLVRGDEGAASTSGAKTSATAPDALTNNGTTKMTNASVEESTSTRGATGTSDATNISQNSVSDYVDALTTLASMPRAVRACRSFKFSFHARIPELPSSLFHLSSMHAT